MSIRNLSVDFAFYGALDVLQRSIGIVMLPLYTRVLTQKEYGDLDVMIVLSSFLFVLVDLQFTAGFSRLYFESRDQGNEKRFVGTAITGRLIGALVVVAGFAALGYLGQLEFSFLPSFELNSTAWLLATFIIPFTLCYDILLLHARMLRLKRTFAVGSLSNVLVSCTLSAYFAVVTQLGLVSVLFGLFIGKLIGLSVLAWDLRHHVTVCLDRGQFTKLIRYTWPLIPAVWVTHAAIYGNRFFVFALVGAEENAVLSLCMKFVSVLGMFAVAFQSAWQPIAMSTIGTPESDTFYTRSTRLFIAGSLFSMFAVTAMLDPVMGIFAPNSYGSVTTYFPLFAVGMVLSTCSTNIQVGHQIAKTTHWISLSSFVAVAINVGLLLALLQPYGVSGAGMAWLVSFAGGFLVMYYTAQRVHRINYDTRAFTILGFGCVLLLAIGWLGSASAIPSWLVSFFALAASVLLPWLVMKNSELGAVQAFLKQKLRPVKAEP